MKASNETKVNENNNGGAVKYWIYLHWTAQAMIR